MPINTEFNSRKEQVVSSLVEYVDPERRDKSPKGFIDAPILDLMHIINQHPDYYTTSSCSGRVAIYQEGIQVHGDKEETTTKGGIWLYVTHDPVPLPTTDKEEWIIKLLFNNQKVVFNNSQDDPILDRQLIYFKFEPLILHIEASSQEKAMHLVSLANQVGYQNSGITPSRRHMLAIRSTLKIDTPIGYVKDNTIHCLVEPSYLILLFEMSNIKFEQNLRRMKIFEDAMKVELEKANSEKDIKEWETREERRERKKKEGLAKRMAIEKEKKKEKKENLDDLLEDVSQIVL
ncbi:methyltransferase TYW3-domain-containing protein [Cokeromyces recurvatus]|uniref:methyltransferase TYW3-domain-containing protein n=1 Tax=Cokeromyces recurvatus TaxID=90255 RepID=UPI0022211C6E|nr:methyltransferase TYW3-domain-containing protein [Cokeromyces recurvatus]KAI7904146.1 methyltransferase TYW3-domain-containing protein [Cokeromyces recurvatus]